MSESIAKRIVQISTNAKININNTWFVINALLKVTKLKIEIFCNTIYH